MPYDGNASNCFSTQYPQISGSADNDYHYRTFDIDANGNVVLGGSCFDSMLCDLANTTNPAPIVEYLNNEGLFIWSKQLVVYNKVQDHVAAIRFKPDGTQVAVLLAKKGSISIPLVIAFIQTYDGSLSYSLSDQISNIPRNFQANSLYFDNSGNLYIAMGSDGYSYLLKLQATYNSPLQVLMKSTQQSSSCGSFDSMYVQSTNLYIAGKVFDSAVCKNRLTKFQTTDDTQVWTITDETTQIATINSIVVQYYAGTQYAYSCGSVDANSEKSIILRQKLDISDTSGSKVFTSQNQQSCLAIYPESIDLAYAFMLKDTTSNKVLLVKIKFDTDNILDYNFGDVFDYPGNQFFHAKFIDSTKFNLIGTIKHYFGIVTPSYSNNMGYFTKLSTTEGLHSNNCDIQPTVVYTTNLNYQATTVNPTIVMGDSALLTKLESTTNMTQAGTQIKDFEQLNLIRRQCHLNQDSTSFPILPSMINQDFDIGTQIGNSSYNFPQFTFSDTTCITTFAYNITVTPNDTSLINMQRQPISRWIYWSSQSIVPKLYTVTIEGLAPNGLTDHTFFTINLSNSCTNAQIDPSVIAVNSYSYIIGQPQIVIQISPFISTNPSGCGITYTYNPNINGQWYVIQFNQQNQKITIYHPDNSGLENTYPVIIFGQIYGYRAKTQTSTITVAVKHECYSSIITSSTLSDIEYDIFLSPTASVKVQWPHNLLTICPQPTTYIITESGSAISNTMITENQADGILEIQIITKNILDVGLKTILVKAQIVNVTSPAVYSQTEQSFVLNITNRCLLESQIISQVLTNDIYYLDNPIKIYHLNAWTQTIVECDNIFSYTVNFSPQPSDSTGSPIISYNSGYNDISIKTSDISMTSHSPITVTITGSLLNSLSKSITFDISILNPCDDPLFQISTLLPSDIYLYLSGVEITENIPIVTSNASLTFCGSLKQSLIVLDNTNINYNSSSFLTWNEPENKIILLNKIGALQLLSPFNLTIVTKHSIQSQAPFEMKSKIHISGECYVLELGIDNNIFDASNVMAVQEYSIYSSAQNINITKFTDPIQCGYPIHYSLRLANAEKVPTFITADYSGPSIIITLLSNSRADYFSTMQTLILTGSVKNPDSTAFTQTVYIPLNIILVNQGPPYFKQELKTVTVQIGKLLEVSLPEIVDPDMEDKGQVQIISYGGADQFSSFTKPKISFTPTKTKGAMDMTYTISITLKDDSPLPKSETYSFDLVVTAATKTPAKANSTSVPKSPTNETIVKSPPTPPAQSNSNPSTKPIAIPKIKKPPVIDNKIFKAAIDVVGQDGSFNILFSKNIQLPTSQLFNNNTMRIMVRSTVRDENDVLQIREITNWTMTSLGKDEMKIQIVFQESIKVSPTADYDKLSVKFLKDNMIFSADQINVLDSKEILMSGVPPQLPTGKLAILLGKSTKAASAAVTGAISSNLVLAVVLGVSMKKLWMMVSALQIIVHFPMLKIPLPANFIMILTAVVDIVNLGIVPKVYIKKFLSYFMEDTKSNGENGLVFFVLVIFALVAVLIILARKFLSKYQLIQKLQERLSRELFFNPFFRSHLNGYIKFCLAALIALSNFGDQNLVNKVFTILFMGYLLVVPIVFFMILYKTPQSKLDSPSFKVRCEQLYSNIRTDSKLALSYNIWYLLRRLFLAFTITFLGGSPLLQGFVLIISSMIMITYMITVKPFDSTNMLYFEISNEATILCVSYMIFVNADLLNDEQIRLDIGWFVTAILALNIFANFVNVVAQMMSSIIYNFRLIYRKIRNFFMKKPLQKVHQQSFRNLNADSIDITQLNSLSPRSAPTIKAKTIYIQHAKSYFNHFSYSPKNDFEINDQKQPQLA